MGYGHRTEGINLTSRDVSPVVSHTGRVSERSFQVTVITLTVIAFLISLGRLCQNKRHNTRIFLDDGLLVVAILCLIVETGCIYDYAKTLFLVDGKALDRPFSEWIKKEEDMRRNLEAFRPGRIVVSSVFAWVSILGVKFSCLAFCARVTRSTTRSFRGALSGALGTTAVSGIIIFILLFIQCPRLSRYSMECVTRQTWAPALAISVIEQILNISTTLMIIGVFLLRFKHFHVQFDRKTTLSLATIATLCCSSIALGITRAAGGVHHNTDNIKQISAVWNCLLLHCEAAISVVVGSAATLYRQSQNRDNLYVTDHHLNTSASFTSRIKSAGALILPSRMNAKENSNANDNIEDVMRNESCKWPAPLGQDLETPRMSVYDFRSSMESSGFVVSGDIADEGNNRIRVTVECTITSEEASQSELELAREEIIGREWDGNQSEECINMNTVVPPGGLNVNTMEGLDPALIGMITSGMRF